MSAFGNLAELPGDPILSLSAQFREDSRLEKIDLGVGVYRSEAGETPIMASVQEAGVVLARREKSKAYLPPTGTAGFQSAVAQLVLGDDHPILESGRTATLPCVGGSGALHLGARLLASASPEATLWLGNPTWANHAHLLGSAGAKFSEYPYYDGSTHSVDFEGMCASLTAAKRGDVVLLHGCCHNPSGADLSFSHWQTLTDLVLEQGLMPFVDIAYMGLGSGLQEDAAGLRYMAERVPEMLIAVSFSKNFGLYRERAGALITLAEDRAKAATVTSHLSSMARGIYSMPPAHGCALVEEILHSRELTEQWLLELEQMRERINGLRGALASALSATDQSRDYSYLKHRLGMFCYLGLSVSAVRELREKHAIYMVDSSRINIAGINHSNLHRLVDALITVG